MSAATMIQYITDTFDGVDVAEAFGYQFFFYDPRRTLPQDRRFPFATIATQDSEHDNASNLSRPGVYRLNIGVEKETYRSLFGPPPSLPEGSLTVATGHDFTVLDQLLPHPTYAPQSWVCILSPSDATFQKTVAPLLAEAYQQAVRKYEKLGPT